MKGLIGPYLSRSSYNSSLKTYKVHNYWEGLGEGSGEMFGVFYDMFLGSFWDMFGRLLKGC